MITGKNKMADLIHLNYLLISVINRFGINLGFGDKSVQEVCQEYDVKLDFFLEIVNSFHDEDYFPEEHLQDFSVSLITDYLSKTHRYYLDVKIPELEKLINLMVVECYANNKYAVLLESFFREYKNELITHTKREDEKVFPYSISTELAFMGKDNSLIESTAPENYSIQEYSSEHDDIESKLYDLKNIIIKYLLPTGNPSLCSKVLTELFNLEKDLNDHSRIEEKVLIPKVLLMEKKLKTRK